LGAFPNIYQLGDEIPWLNEPLMEINVGTEEVPKIIHVGTKIIRDDKKMYY